MRDIVHRAGLVALTALTLAAGPAAIAQTAGPAAAAAPAPAPMPVAAPAAPATPVAAPAAGGAGGTLIAGVCMISQEALIARSRIGQGVTARLRELAQQAQANLTAEKSRLEARGKALEAKRATLTPLQLQAQGQALQQRAQALQAEAGERSQAIDAAKTRAFNAVIGQAQPFIAQAYGAHGCGLLFAREAVVTGNLGNDLTPEVVAALDAKGAPVSVELEPPHPSK